MAPVPTLTQNFFALSAFGNKRRRSSAGYSKMKTHTIFLAESVQLA